MAWVSCSLAQPQTPLNMAEHLELQLSQFIGTLLPDINTPYTCYQGVLPLPEAAPEGFPQDFLEGLVSTNRYGVATWPVSLRVDDATGVTFFYNADGTAFWEVPPNETYRPDWIEELHGGGLTPLMQALLAPSRVGAQWLFIAEQDISTYHEARLASLAPPKPTAPLDDPDLPQLRVTAFAPYGDSYLFASRWNTVAYFPLSRMDVLFTSDLLSPDWIPVRSIPVSNTDPARAAFFDVPRAMLPPLDETSFTHDSGCAPVTNIVVSPVNLDISYTNVVCGCPHPPKPSGFFRLSIPDPSQNIPAWWRVLYGFAPHDSWEDGVDFNGDGYTNSQKYELGRNPIAPPDASTATTIQYHYDDDDRLTSSFIGTEGDAAVTQLTPAGNPKVQQERTAQ